ncbi:MAG TPA: hypothetical protein VGM88_08710 [Kofleriaceae bacterium]
MPKTLAEIAIDAGLVTKAGIVKAGKISEERKQPLVVVLVRELGVDEVALVGAIRKQTRVPLLDPAEVLIDPEALRQVPRDMCARLRVLPIAQSNNVLRLAMADPTDTSAIAEIEQQTRAEIEVSALPLSAIDELVSESYRQFTTAVVRRKLLRRMPEVEGEISVTAQIPLSSLQAPDDLEARFTALVHVLMAKGLVTEADLAEALRKLKV